MHQHDDFPRPAGRTAWLYLRDPHRLAVAGRQLGPKWSFWHPVHHPVPVVSRRELAEEVLDARLFAVAGWRRYEDWIGQQPFGPWGDRMQRSLIHTINLALAERDPRYHVETALRPIAKSPGDVGQRLREAALLWILDMICQADQQRLRTAHAVAKLVPAKLRLLNAIGECAPGKAFDGPAGTILASGYLTLLGPVVDALPMVAMAALTFRGQMEALRIERAMATAHPMPLLLLEARKFISSLPLSHLMLDAPDADALDFCPGGAHVAVDLAGAGLPWGVGPFAPVFRAVVEKFAHAVLGAAAELDLTVVEHPRRGRVRMCFGVTRLRMAKWPG